MHVIVINTKEKTLALKSIKTINGKSASEILLSSGVLIGRTGATKFKQEGDGKTPIGIFKIGVVFGIYDRKNIKLHDSLEYIKINKNLYWVDDVNSKYYNKLVDAAKVEADWKSAEHLIDYPIQYEYAVEIKTNPQNIPGKGSAIFIHCSNGKETAGCISISKEKMISLLEKIDKNTKVIIEL